jgi:hypothetical protein
MGTAFDRTHQATSHPVRKVAYTGGNRLTGAAIDAREGVGAKKLHSQGHQPLGMYQQVTEHTMSRGSYSPASMSAVHRIIMLLPGCSKYLRDSMTVTGASRIPMEQT